MLVKLGKSFWYLAPSIIFVTALGLFPTAFTLFYSFHFWRPRYMKAPEFAGLANYFEATSSPDLGYSFGFTAALVGLIIAIESVLALGIALLLNRETRLARISRIMVIIPMVSTPIITATIWRYLLNYSFGPLTYLLTLVGFPRMEFFNTIPGILLTFALVDAWQWTPFIAVIVLSGLYALPQDVYESASIDGASALGMLKNITLPLLKPVIAIAVVLRTMDALKIFDIIFAITGGGPGNRSESISIAIYRIGFKFWDLSYAASVSILFLVLAAAIGVIFIFFLRKELTEVLR